MISTTTRLTPSRPEDGSLMDLNPYRRAARLRAAGVTVVRTAPWTYAVALPDGSLQRRRTFGAAQRTAHAFVEQTLAT